MEQIEALPDAPESEIELARVERELAALWTAAAPEDPRGEPAVLRACALNLLVLGASPADLERARPIAARTTLAHPSRVVLLAPVPNAASGVGARIWAFCHRLGGGGRHVCCEEITAIARGAAAERLAEAALPLLLPDLPVHLWILDDGQDVTGPDRASLAVGAQRLAELADEVIWSARMPDDPLLTTPARSRLPAVVDLDWMRLRPWRELTAQLFEPPERRPLLDRLDSVEVVIAAPPANRPGAGWLWIGWLASRLGWDGSEGTAGATGRGGEVAWERQLMGPAGAVRARVVPSEAAGVASGELLSVRIYVRGAVGPMTLERLPAPDPADLWIGEGPTHRVPFGLRDEAALLGEALDGASRDRIYQATWETAVRLWKRSG